MHASRWWILVAGLLTACTTTRTLAGYGGLITSGHGAGFTLPTDTRFRSRVEPDSTLYLQANNGAWTAPIKAGDAYADENGLWVTKKHVGMETTLDRVEIEGAGPLLGTLIAATQPKGATLIHARDTYRYVLDGGNALLQPWLHDLSARIRGSDSDDLRQPLSLIIGTSTQGYRRTVINASLDQFIELDASSKFGWAWRDVSTVEVQNWSAGKTFGLSVGIAALAVAMAPVVIAAGLGASAIPSGGGGSGIHISHRRHVPAVRTAVDVAGTILVPNDLNPPLHDGTFEATLAPVPVDSSARMFTTAARVHNIIRGTLTLDGGAAFAGDQLGTGVLAHVRLGEMFELGAGAREVFTRDANQWHASTTPVIAFGWHLPLDAEYRFAIPVGFEVSWGGDVAHDVRFPIGLRYTTHDGRYFGTLYPATPQNMRVDTEKNGRWSFATSLELGVMF